MTTATTPSKDTVAERLADAHFDIESGIARIFRLIGPREEDPRDPVKLLEVNENTVATGIVPVGFGPHAAGGIVYPSIIVEITPEEFERLREGQLLLPDGWVLGREYLKQRVGDAPSNHI